MDALARLGLDGTGCPRASVICSIQPPPRGLRLRCPVRACRVGALRDSSLGGPNRPPSGGDTERESMPVPIDPALVARLPPALQAMVGRLALAAQIQALRESGRRPTPCGCCSCMDVQSSWEEEEDD